MSKSIACLNDLCRRPPSRGTQTNLLTAFQVGLTIRGEQPQNLNQSARIAVQFDDVFGRDARGLMQPTLHQCPVLGIETHGSFGASAAPFCNSSIECRSGERTNAIMPSRGGRLMVTPACMSLAHSA